jgi:hypothetical protein
MNKIELLLTQWGYCYDDTEWDWYPPLTQALKGLAAEQADWRPQGDAANTIWENVQHLIFYKERLLKRLTGEEAEYPPGLINDDTFTVTVKGERAWQETLSRLETVHNGIKEQIKSLREEDFERPIPKTPIGLWITNLALHDAYHTGQIMMVRKLQGSWPKRRVFE